MSRILKGEAFDAREEAPQIREDARREGYEEGRQAGLASVTEMLLRAQQRVAASEDELRRLAVRIAEKILAAELTLRPEAVIDVVKAAMADARRRRQITVRVHPDDLTIVKAAGFPAVADASITRGGCIVETEVGTLDARLETQLAAITKALTGEEP